MKALVLRPVAEFVNDLEAPIRADVLGLIELLEQYGHALSMPYVKPIGGGLWELRRTGRPQIRILYGFCGGGIVLVHALKKQRTTLRRQDITLARKRLADYCG